MAWHGRRQHRRPLYLGSMHLLHQAACIRARMRAGHVLYEREGRTLRFLAPCVCQRPPTESVCIKMFAPPVPVTLLATTG